MQSLNKIHHSWKGIIEINGIEYHWEQFATSNPKITIVAIFNPIQISFEFMPHQNNLGNTIEYNIKNVKTFALK